MVIVHTTEMVRSMAVLKSIRFSIYHFTLCQEKANALELASQMVLQDIRVLHVGNFKLPEEEEMDAQLKLQPTPTPQPGAPAVNTAAGAQPDIITLIVTPQDAVTLTYLYLWKSQTHPDPSRGGGSIPCGN